MSIKKSILQDKRECYVTKKRFGISYDGHLEFHHIYAGKNRKVSDRNGFWVYLTPYYHRESNEAVHGRDGKALDEELKQDCQRKFEESHTRAEFMKLIGRNYINDGV